MLPLFSSTSALDSLRVSAAKSVLLNEPRSCLREMDVYCTCPTSYRNTFTSRNDRESLNVLEGSIRMVLGKQKNGRGVVVPPPERFVQTT